MTSLAAAKIDFILIDMTNGNVPTPLTNRTNCARFALYHHHYDD
jgi:hypothetical protein